MKLPRRISKRHVLAGLVLLSAVSCVVRPGGIDSLRAMVGPFLAPFSHASTYALTRISRNIDQIGDGPLSPEQSRRLRDELDARRRQVDVYHQLLAEQNHRLAEQGGWRTALVRFPCLLIPATVIGGDSTPFSRSKLLRKSSGGGDGALVVTRCDLAINRPTAVPTDLAVLSAQALVGRLVASGAWAARMQTLLDPDFAIPARVIRVYDPDRPRIMEVYESGALVERTLRGNDEAIKVNLFGQGSDLMVTAEVPRYHGFAPGDRLVTTGERNELPFGVSIGRVERVEPVANNPQHVRLLVRPDADLADLDRVYIVQWKGRLPE